MNKTHIVLILVFTIAIISILVIYVKAQAENKAIVEEIVSGGGINTEGMGRVNYILKVDAVEDLLPSDKPIPHYTAERLLPPALKKLAIADDYKLIQNEQGELEFVKYR